MKVFSEVFVPFVAHNPLSYHRPGKVDVNILVESDQNVKHTFPYTHYMGQVVEENDHNVSNATCF